MFFGQSCCIGHGLECLFWVAVGVASSPITRGGDEKKKKTETRRKDGILPHVIIGADRSSVNTFFSLTDEKTLSLGCSSCSSSSSLTLS